MQQVTRTIAATLILALGTGGALLSLTPVAVAQQGAEAEADPEAEAKAAAREARIEEYLRKREERRAQRELERQQKAGAAGAVDLSTFSTGTAPAAPAGDAVLPPEMARIQQIIRTGPLGTDPSIQAYLELIDRAEASPQQLAAFGNYLESAGWPQGAVVYYEVALSIEQSDAILWLNAGTVYRKLHRPKSAVDAYIRALSIDPNNARAHYNLGAVYDEQGKYEEALEEYKIALLLDPLLGDPATNPQVAHNERILAVKLMLYQEQVGMIGLPLADVPGGELDAPPGTAPEEPR